MRLPFLIATLALAPALKGQESTADAAHFFSTAPSSVIQFIQPNTRLDMIDYFKAGLDTPSDNNVGGKCRITELSDTSVKLLADEGVSYQLFVIGQGDKTVIGVIQTVDTPVPDSSMKLYGPDWEQLPQSRWIKGSLSEWLTPEGRKQRTIAERDIPYLLATFEWDDATRTVTATNTTAANFVEGDAPAALSLLRPTLVYRWNGKSFKPADK